MLIGYARTSTTDQIAGLKAQERDLLAQGCERLWREQTSALGPVTPWRRPSRSLDQGTHWSSPRFVGWPVPSPTWWRLSTDWKRRA